MGGIIPTGIWVMDEARSRKLAPGSLTMWMIRDDGDRMNWVSVETDPAGQITVNSFEGVYGGPPATVQGNGFIVSLTSPGPRSMKVAGEVPGMGPFEEVSVISEDGRTMITNGQVKIGDDVQTWYEEFNWQGPSPHAAPLTGAPA
jgi:hypothetical protein